MACFTRAGPATALVAASLVVLPAAAFGKNDGTSNAGGQDNAPPPQAQAAPPAQSETPPGQSTEPPGNSGSAPGQANEPAAQSGEQSQSRQSQSQDAARANPQTQSSSGFGSGGPQSGPDQGSGEPGTLNSDCTAHKDPADPGSCQEKGGGNSYDRDPYRGPNRGNDCDEGGGNNVRGEVTNPNNADSPDDSDRGQGNNRCAPRTTTEEPPPENPPENPPGGPGTQSTPPPAGVTPEAPAQQVAGVNETLDEPEPADDEPERDDRGVSDEAPGVVPGELRKRRTASAGELPFTGAHALWLALMGLLLCGLSVATRAGLARR